MFLSRRSRQRVGQPAAEALREGPSQEHLDAVREAMNGLVVWTREGHRRRRGVAALGRGEGRHDLNAIGGQVGEARPSRQESRRREREVGGQSDLHALTGLRDGLQLRIAEREPWDRYEEGGDRSDAQGWNL